MILRAVWLRAAFPILALAPALLALGALGIAAPTPSSPPAPATPPSSAPPDAGLLERLALALLGGVPQAPGATTRLLVGKLPDDVGLTLPLPDGALVVGTLERRVADGFGDETDVILDAPGAPVDVLALLRRELLGLGWREPAVSDRSSASLGLCRDASPTRLVMGVGARADGRSDVRLQLFYSVEPCPEPATR